MYGNEKSETENRRTYCCVGSELGIQFLFSKLEAEEAIQADEKRKG